MQYIRGYLFFEDTTKSLVENNLKSFRLNQSEIFFFSQIKINQEVFNQPGVLIDGMIKKEYSSHDIIKTFRKIVGLEVLVCNCDISLESEDDLMLIKKGKIEGFYSSLHFLCNNKSKMVKLAKQVSDVCNSNNTVLRKVGTGEWSVDVVSEKEVDIKNIRSVSVGELVSVSSFKII